ncbi:signal peptide peptidase SppA [Candidatus Micrarchaeota archaeon]|nr:signal peptide peptidase SppA [Candidatus Micrarchaeota archaeon]
MDFLKIIAILIAILAFTTAGAWAFQTASESSCVSVLHIDGPIGLYPASGQASARDIVQALESFQSGSSKALLVEINSPGGSAVASTEIYDALRALNESGKTTVGYLSEVAASGGYYSAAGTQYIVANPNTITGSIGAVTDVTNYEELLNKIGVQQYAIKSGALKDIGAGYRNMTLAEKALLQELITETAGRFVTDVRAGRSGKLTEAFEPLLDARIISAKTALNAGLVDQIGSRKDALIKAAALSGLQTDGGTTPMECDITPQIPALSDIFSNIGFSMAQGFSRGLSGQNVKAQT